MAKIIKDFQVEVSMQEILRLLGHISKHGNIKKRSKELVEEMISFSCDLIKPEGIFVIRESRELPEECFFNAEKVALCICTIDKLLEKQVERLTNQGELARAVTLDAIGSVAAESAAEHLNQVIADEAKKKKLYCSTRFSPGYGGWNLEAQRFIFDLLPAEKIGVRLNRSFMMIPRKSVSFAINLSRNPFRDKGSTTCEICGLKKCRFKKDAKRSATLLEAVEKVKLGECHSESAEGETKNLYLNQRDSSVATLPQNDRMGFFQHGLLG